MQECPQNSLISLRCHQVLRVVLFGHDALHNGHYAPKGPLLFQEEERDGSKTVETLAVAHFWVVPTEGYKDTPKLVDLRAGINIQARSSDKDTLASTTVK